MACNLGARPVGPILLKRFDRLFDGPPKVLKSHGKEGANVSWLDIVEFARNKPDQFQLSQMSEGVRVCQIYTKQCRVQISEDDYVLISSGIPHKMIPPQPILEDEEKELGTLEILEKNLGQICQLADQVAARTRQLNHRFKGRKQAILDRRATASPAPPMRPSSPSNVALMNGATQAASASLANITQSQSPGGFVPVNPRPHGDQNGNGATLATRQELLSKFHTVNDHRQSSQPPNGHLDDRRPSIGQPSAPHPGTPSTKPVNKPPNSGPSSLIHPTAQYNDPEINHMLLPTASPVPIPNTPTSLLPNSNARSSAPQEKDDGGPFKAEMMRKVEGLAKGARILPPCDRCRRLHMDCIKNLTACAGCTKKHAKCSWKEVRESELRGGPVAHPPQPLSGGSAGASEAEDVESGFEKASTGSPPAPRSGTGPISASGPAVGPGRSPSHPGGGESGGGQHPVFPLPDHSQAFLRRTSPPDKGLDPQQQQQQNVQLQLQEAAKSGLAAAASHAGRVGVSEIA